ncbi:MAG: alanine racemase [Acutalibacteraceae bacterium]
MTDFIKRTWAEINLDAATHNYKEIRKRASSGAMVCCVIKADGYGHGAVMLAHLYEKLGADWFAVSNIEEAMQLRSNGITKPILILGYTPAECAQMLSENNISQAVYSIEYAAALNESAEKAGVKIKIHLKLDTGMSRIGLLCQSKDEDNEAVSLGLKICSMPAFETEGVFTHFAVADEGDDGESFTSNQFDNFMYTVGRLEDKGVKFKIRHCANSGAIEDYPQMHLDMVRAGIVLYGLAPSEKIKNPLNLQPVMELKSAVSHTKEIYPGMTVSYGRTYTADRSERLATIPVGYADGYVRSIAKDGYVLIHGKRAKIRGRICMDQCMVDISDIDDVKIGDVATVFGRAENAPGADDIAKWIGTINYEVTCIVGKRVARVYLKNNEVISAHTLLDREM